MQEHFEINESLPRCFKNPNKKEWPLIPVDEASNVVPVKLSVHCSVLTCMQTGVTSPCSVYVIYMRQFSAIVEVTTNQQHLRTCFASTVLFCTVYIYFFFYKMMDEPCFKKLHV